MIVTASRREIGLRRGMSLASQGFCHEEQRIGTTAKGSFVVVKIQQNIRIQSASKISVSQRP